MQRKASQQNHVEVIERHLRAAVGKWQVSGLHWASSVRQNPAASQKNYMNSID